VIYNTADSCQVKSTGPYITVTATHDIQNKFMEMYNITESFNLTAVARSAIPHHLHSKIFQYFHTFFQLFQLFISKS
jgi:uncharacterized protein YodC (DUF2158 family)